MDYQDLEGLRRKRGFLCVGGPAMIGGVCSAFAEKFETQTWKVRILFFLFGQFGLTLVYIVAWLFVAKED